MSISGSLTMDVLRALQPGKGSYRDLSKLRRRAERENASFRFSLPHGRGISCRLVPGTERPCPVIRPKRCSDHGKAVLYIYGGVTNTWRAQLPLARRFARDTGADVWYPVYPAMSEVPIAASVAYLADVYLRMLERYPAEGITLCGVSMGGLFALQAVSAINKWELGVPMPGLVIAHSAGGFPDSEADWDPFRSYEQQDPLFAESDLRMTEIMTPRARGGEAMNWPLYPMQGDFRGAPPTYLYYGEEMLAGNVPLYRRAFERDGAGDRLHVTVTRNMMHCYSCLPVFPESRRSYGETVRLVKGLRLGRE